MDCLTLKNLNAVVLSHEKESTKRLFSKALFYLDHLEEKPPTLRESAEMIRFKHTNSTFYIGTAGSKAFGRGDDIHRLHLSELAFWNKPENIMLGLKEAMAGEDSRIVIETTANGQGTYFHKSWTKAKKGEGTYKPHFFTWFEDDEYRIKGVLNNPTQDELALRAMGASDEHLLWRRKKISDIGLNGFLQEFPSDDVSCFRESGQSFFQSQDLVLGGVQEESGASGKMYLVGVDPAEGNPNSDDSAIVVINLTDSTICKSLKGKWTPDITAQKAIAEAKKFNSAKIVPERNNHGHAVITYITNVEHYFHLYIHTDFKYGWVTTSGNKHPCLDDFEESLRKKELKIACKDVLDQCAEMRYDEKGDIVSSNEEHHYDLVMASAIAWQSRKNRGVKIINRK